MSIEDPRAAQGGSLKGCPVCGGKYYRRCHCEHQSSRNLQVLGTGSRIVRSWRIPSVGKWPHIASQTTRDISFGTLFCISTVRWCIACMSVASRVSADRPECHVGEDDVTHELRTSIGLALTCLSALSSQARPGKRLSSGVDYLRSRLICSIASYERCLNRKLIRPRTSRRLTRSRSTSHASASV